MPKGFPFYTGQYPRVISSDVCDSSYLISEQPGFEAMLKGLREDGLVIDAVHKLV